MNQRELSLDILLKTLYDSKYTNLLMRKELNKLPNIQRAFCVALINGVLRNYLYLEYSLKDYINSKTSLRLKTILIMAIYEKYYMNSKEYAINNEYVNLGRNKYEKGFINAILRKDITLIKLEEDNIENISIKYSIPLWISKLIKSQYPDEYLDILSSFNSENKVYYRLNKKYYSYDDIKSFKYEIINDEIFISDEYIIDSFEYQKGIFYIQDINSNEIVKYLDLNKNDLFLDICSAPGSKLFNALDIIDDNNSYSNDINENRLNLIKKNAQRLGFNNIHYSNYDGRYIDKEFDILFDKILIDAPCSGIGVIKRKPDLKYHLNPNSLDELENIQAEILNSASKLLKENGILVYSTCTLNKKENIKQIEKFINNHNDFKLIEEKTLLDFNGDYFYLAKLKRL